jgi:hypothetical protein
MKYNLLILIILIIGCNEKNENEKNKSSANDLNKEIINKSIPESESIENCITNFDKFFIKFSKDSVFQKNMIKFPLKCKIPDENDPLSEKTIINLVNKLEFRYINFTLDSLAMKKEVERYTIKKKVQKDNVIYTQMG